MRLGVCIFFVLLIGSCSPKRFVHKNLKEIETTLQDHVGFVLFDPETKRNLIDFNGSHYFTPASNTKIFTFYTSLKLLGDSITAIKYIQRNDSIIFWGLGDPSFLYDNVFQNQRTFDFLKNIPGKLFFSTSNFQTESLGAGWAWDDYPYSYSAERSPFPMFGNLVKIKKKDSIVITSPTFFTEHFVKATETHLNEEIVRDLDSNLLTYYSGKNPAKEWKVPFHYGADLVADLLTDTLKRQVEVINFSLPKNALILKSSPIDSLYKVMMEDSDNFIAEQLLLQCAAMVSDTLKPEIAIRYSLKNLLNDLPDKPQWVDGSGLSRYNLFTPRTVNASWEKIYRLVPRERLFSLLAIGGKKGTIKNWYRSDPPFIYGKTGTISNNHCLSGFLITKKGKTLIFCWMNNNYVDSTDEVRRNMEKLLLEIRGRF